jgi:hypothetical protein
VWKFRIGIKTVPILRRTRNVVPFLTTRGKRQPHRYKFADLSEVKSLCLTNHHAINAYWGSGGIAPRILYLGTRWRRVFSSRPGRFTPKERAPGNHWIGGWVGSKSRSGHGVEDKSFQSPPGFEPRSSERPSQSLYQMS